MVSASAGEGGGAELGLVALPESLSSSVRRAFGAVASAPPPGLALPALGRLAPLPGFPLLGILTAVKSNGAWTGDFRTTTPCCTMPVDAQHMSSELTCTELIYLVRMALDCICNCNELSPPSGPLDNAAFGRPSNVAPPGMEKATYPKSITGESPSPE